MFELDISEEYLNREAAQGKPIGLWIYSYCKRNKIDIKYIHTYIQKPAGHFYGDTDEYRRLSFKSNWQLDCFVRAGNRVFPYFEFR